MHHESDAPIPAVPHAAAPVTHEPYGILPDGREVDRYTLATPRIEAQLISYGGTLVSLRVPDRHGVMANVTLGHDSLQAYLTERRWFGALIGRYANRIAGGRFTLDGREYALERNHGTSHLHGGSRGFDKALWRAEPAPRSMSAVTLQHASPAGDGGYPGALAVRVTYTVTAGGELVIDYAVTSDAPTPVNLTQHAYFTLAGAGSGDILNHDLWLNARRYTPVDASLIPTGDILPVAGTPFDFTTPRPIGDRIDGSDEQLRFGGGYDHNFVLERSSRDGLSPAARVHEAGSGRTLTVFTTEPGLQVYTGNFLTADGQTDVARRGGVTLETQHFPDSPNQPGFPSTILRPGRTLSSRTVYEFSVAG